MQTSPANEAAMCPRCHSRYTKTFYLDLFPDIACPADADTEAICLDCGLVFDWSEASIICTDCYEELDAVVAAFDQRCPECHLAVCDYCRVALSEENPFPFWEPHEVPPTLG